MQKREIYYYIGFIAGAAITALMVVPVFGWTGIWRTIACVVGGIGGGILGEYTYKSYRK